MRRQHIHLLQRLAPPPICLVATITEVSVKDSLCSGGPLVLLELLPGGVYCFHMRVEAVVQQLHFLNKRKSS